MLEETADFLPLHVMQEVASIYGLEEARLAGEPLEGTGYVTFRLVTDKGDLALRRKKGSALKIITKHPDIGARIERQHALISFLRDQGFPVAAPLLTKRGRTYASVMGVPHSLYPFIYGQSMDPSNTRQLTIAALTLARYHLLTAGYQGTSPLCQDPFPKLFQGTVDRFHMYLQTIEMSMAELGMAEVLTAFNDILDDVSKRMLTVAYDALPKAVIHGDYKPGNILFQGDKLVAVIDFGRSRSEARILDLARTIPGLVRDEYNKRFLDLAHVFATAYDELYPLQVAEREAMPLLMQARVASKTMEKFANLTKRRDTAKKVKKAHRASEQVRRLQWLRDNASALRTMFENSSAPNQPKTWDVHLR